MTQSRKMIRKTASPSLFMPESEALLIFSRSIPVSLRSALLAAADCFLFLNFEFWLAIVGFA